MRFIVKFSVSLFALLIKRLKALFSGVWECGGGGFSVGVKAATAGAAIEVDMEDLVEAETAEIVEVKAGAAVEGVNRQAEAAVEGVSVQAGVAVEVDRVLDEVAG